MASRHRGLKSELAFPIFARPYSVRVTAPGLDISYETVRRWVLKFGPVFARELRRRRPRPTSTWHLDEMAVAIAGRQFWLWRAVDDEGEVLDLLVQRRRDKAAAVKLSGRTVSFARPTRSCARLAFILPRRSSITDTSDERFTDNHPRSVWGRADLRDAADRPIHLPRAHAAKRANPAKQSAHAAGCEFSGFCHAKRAGRAGGVMREAEGLLPMGAMRAGNSGPSVRDCRRKTRPKGVGRAFNLRPLCHLLLRPIARLRALKWVD